MAEDEGIKALCTLIAQQAWQPVMSMIVGYGSNGQYEPQMSMQPSPLLQGVAKAMVEHLKEDGEIREILINGLREAIVTPEFKAEMLKVLPQIVVRAATTFDRATMPQWVSDALRTHLEEWLSSEQDTTEIIERMLVNGKVAVTVTRESAEPRRTGY